MKTPDQFLLYIPIMLVIDKKILTECDLRNRRGAFLKFEADNDAAFDTCFGPGPVRQLLGRADLLQLHLAIAMLHDRCRSVKGQVQRETRRSERSFQGRLSVGIDDRGQFLRRPVASDLAQLHPANPVTETRIQSSYGTLKRAKSDARTIRVHSRPMCQEAGGLAFIDDVDQASALEVS